MNNCPKCGVKMTHDKNFCIVCGYYAHKPVVETRPSIYRKKINKWVFVGIIVFIILLLFGINIYKDYKVRSYITPVNELVMNVNSESYVNDLYISDEHVYKYLLDNKEKEIYRLFLNKIKNFEKSVELELEGFNSFYFSSQYVIDISNAIFMDHPELIHYSYISISEINQNHNKLKVDFNYVMNNKQYNDAIDEIKTYLDEIKNDTKDLNEYEKVEYVYNWLGKRNKYDTFKSSMAQSAYSAFNLDLSPVCSGYARASQIIFQNIGINSLLISGSLDNMSHEWNFVMIDNKYYYYDVTQSSTQNKPIKNDISYCGFLFKDHSGYKIHNKEIVPKANGRKYIQK